MAWMPGDSEAAAAVAGMQEIYGQARETGLSITPDVGRSDALDKCIFSRQAGDRIRVVVVQRVGGDGTDPSAGMWHVADAFAVCEKGIRPPLMAVRAREVDTLDRMARRAELWCRLGIWR